MVCKNIKKSLKLPQPSLHLHRTDYITVQFLSLFVSVSFVCLPYFCIDMPQPEPIPEITAKRHSVQMHKTNRIGNMSIQLLLLSQPITNSYILYPSSQSVGFMKCFSSDWFSFLIYLSNLSFRGKLMQICECLSPQAGTNQSAVFHWCDMSTAGGQSETGSLPSELTTVKGVTHIALMRSPALVRYVLQARECERVRIGTGNKAESNSFRMQGAESLIAFGLLSRMFREKWTAFKLTVIYGSCGHQCIPGKEVNGGRERERSVLMMECRRKYQSIISNNFSLFQRLQ